MFWSSGVDPVAVIAAVGAVAAAGFTGAAVRIAKLQLTDSREGRADRRHVAINALSAELGRVAQLAVRWRQDKLVERAIAELLDVTDLQPLDWGQFVVLLGELGQTGSVLGATGYSDMRDAIQYGRALQYKATEFRSQRADMAAGTLPSPMFIQWRDDWLRDVQANLVDPLLQKLDDAAEALGEALRVSVDDRRRRAIVVDGLTSKAAQRWQTSIEQQRREEFAFSKLPPV